MSTRANLLLIWIAIIIAFSLQKSTILARNAHRGGNRFNIQVQHFVPGRVAQSVTCLAEDTCLTAEPVVASSIPARSHTFVEIDHKIFSTTIRLPSADSRRAVVSYKRKYAHEALVNRLVKLVQE